ncbi:MAG TPA: N-acetylglucosamine-6-phosphate deacetylase [Pyrinomonadaceae bacterium]|nr:N-acetylglucosamine-6-phosphate deacetylase [Pyrinomonadaceae bacterium]
MSKLLRKARVVQLERVLETADVLINDGVITAIGQPVRTEPASIDEVVELEGHTLFPGFLDVHIHGAVGVDTLEATGDNLVSVSRFLASRGVTGWLPTFVPAPVPQYCSSIDAISKVIVKQEQSAQGARVLGVHYEGPFVNTNQCGALHTDYFRTYKNEADLNDLPVLNDRKAVHMITVAPEVEGGVELIRELVRRRWIVSLGHTRATVELLDKALEAGARHMTHFMNAMAPFHHRAPGPIAWGLANDQVGFDMIADGIHLDPFMLKLLVKLKGAAGISLISDAIAAAGKGDGEYQIWGETIAVKDGRTSNQHGSIAGSVISMLDAVMMMRKLKVSDVEIAKMASLNPARLLGLDAQYGSIEVGKAADLVALDSHGNVKLTLVGGVAL